ncbi:MAG: transcriptional repressor NrdR [Nitrosarchaeum sp.]|nr:transcriptional repressor NrdR [Nitrosarchaeum sp.]
MHCPYCRSEDTRVVDSRESAENATRRRRECSGCSRRFTTYERIESSPILVIKKDGVRESFDPGKVLGGVLKACEKRKVSREDVERLVQRVEARLAEQGPEVRSELVGELVMEELKGLDKVAYIRFASVYRDFADVEEFEKELRKLLKR